MKSSTPPGLRAAAALCLVCSIAIPAQANPFQSIGSGLKKAGSALNPFKKSAPKPAVEPPAVAKPKPTVAKSTKPAPVKKKKTAPATASSKKSSRSATPKSDNKSTAPVIAATTAAAAADHPEDGSPAGESTASTDVPSPAADAASSTPVEIPFGTPVMGRKGHVRSPYAEDQGMVDVTDIPAGAKVKCPFTGKIFRVP